MMLEQTVINLNFIYAIYTFYLLITLLTPLIEESLSSHMDKESMPTCWIEMLKSWLIVQIQALGTSLL